MKRGQVLISLFPNYKYPHIILQVKMSFVIALSLILHPELLLGEGKTSVSKTGQKPPTSCGCSCQSRLRATSQAPFSSVRGKSHSDLRKVGFGTLDSCLVYHCCLIKKDAIKIPPERGCNSGCNRRGLQGRAAVRRAGTEGTGPPGHAPPTHQLPPCPAVPRCCHE